jgi:hypothetical protein
MAEGRWRRAGGGALWLEPDLEIFTKMPLTQFANYSQIFYKS